MTAGAKWHRSVNVCRHCTVGTGLFGLLGMFRNTKDCAAGPGGANVRLAIQPTAYVTTVATKAVQINAIS